VKKSETVTEKERHKYSKKEAVNLR